MNVLMIEDNQEICNMLKMFFQKEGFEAEFYHDGLEGWQAYQADSQRFDIIILDIQLPSLDGWQILKRIREDSREVPIIMLTARDTESDQVMGLEIGADDYVTKPFSALTLIARMKALHRRSQASAYHPEENETAGFDVTTESMQINTNTREAYYNGALIEDLTPKEFDLLVYFAKSPRRVFTREEILNTLWESPFYGDPRTVDAHIKKLRQKIEKNGDQVIQTVWGVGYKYEEPGDE